MAKVTFKGMSQYGDALRQLELSFARNDDILERAVKAGADPVADEIRNRLAKVPTEPFRRLRLPKATPVHKSYRLSPAYRSAWKSYTASQSFHSLSNSQLIDLMKSFGLTPVSRDKTGFVHTKAGWDGYGSFPTKTYPKGVPNALLAGAVESGSSVRQKTPFVRPAVRATTKKAIEEMDKSLERDLKQII